MDIQAQINIDAGIFKAEASKAMRDYRSQDYVEGYDGRRDAMIDAVEAVMFGSDRWSDVPATTISDIAHEMADEVIRGMSAAEWRG